MAASGESTLTALDRIVAYKVDEVAAAKRAVPIDDVKRRAADAPDPRGFCAALDAVATQDGNALICELKRKSPSAGDILPGADPLVIAQEYEAGGAACLSIMTDGPSFGGPLADLVAIRAHVALPILRKDFMIDPYQVFEARAHGADAILLILAVLKDEQAAELAGMAQDLQMDVLVETHTREELDRAVRLNVGLLGINNRNLKTMTTDLAMTEALAPRLPADVPYVAESGIHSADHVQRLRPAGARRFLIGESLMKAENRRAETRRLVDVRD